MNWAKTAEYTPPLICISVACKICLVLQMMSLLNWHGGISFFTQATDNVVIPWGCSNLQWKLQHATRESKSWEFCRAQSLCTCPEETSLYIRRKCWVLAGDFSSFRLSLNNNNNNNKKRGTHWPLLNVFFQTQQYFNYHHLQEFDSQLAYCQIELYVRRMMGLVASSRWDFNGFDTKESGVYLYHFQRWESGEWF